MLDRSCNGLLLYPRSLYIYFGLGFLLVHKTGLPVLSQCYSVLSLLVDAGCSVGITAFCGTDVGDVGGAELEEPVDKPEDNDRYVVLRAAFYPSAILDELWFLATGPLV